MAQRKSKAWPQKTDRFFIDLGKDIATQAQRKTSLPETTCNC
jgi:hypothetical protein